MEIRTTTQLANFLQFCIDKKSHTKGKLLHAHILRTGLFADTFLSNRLIELYHKCGSLITARRVFDKMPHKNLFSWHAMLSAFCKTGDIEEAHKLFVKMPERNSVSWNTLISALVHNGSNQKALNLYSDMNQSGFLPTNFTLASVLSACGGLKDIICGCACHAFATKIGLDNNIYVGNALLAMYAKCGHTQNAVKTFEDLPEVNEVSFTTMMGTLGETDQIEEAFHMFQKMRSIGIKIDAISMSSILGVCARSGIDFLGQQFHGITIKLGLEQDLHLSNSLLDMYAKYGDMDSAELVFNNLSKVSVVSWNVMIGGYGQKQEIKKSIECMEMMKRFGLEPDEVTYINMLTACLKSGNVETAHEIFNKMTSPSLSSWNALLSGYSQIGKHKETVQLFRNMQFCNVKADRTTFAVVFSSCASLGLLKGGTQVHAATLKFHVDDDIYVVSGLIGMYSKCEKIDLAKCIFNRMNGQDQDIVCWNSMMVGLSFNNLDNESVVLFKNILETEMIPTQFTYASVLSSCTKLSSLSHGKQIHAHVIKHEIVNDLVVGSALIDMYSKCGDVNDARLVFDKMPKKNTIIWNEMIHGYAQNGQGQKGVFLYEEMISEKLKPDAITFIAVLTACSHSGLIDYGIEIFNSMFQEHGIEPISDHYTCVIDALGRDGRFDEVEGILDNMPCVNDPIVWEVLLSSCRVHGNVELAKKAAKELIRLNPCNSAPYVLLANMYSSLEKWDDVRAIRELMVENNAVKNPGFSWVENKNGIREFDVDDNFRMVDKFEVGSDDRCCVSG